MIDSAIKLLREHEPEQEYIGCFSGGKDSVAIKALADMAGVAVEWHYHKTTIDPPPLLSFIKKHHPDVIWDRPKHGNFFNRMVKVGFPTRRNRWCCREFKEAPEHLDGNVFIMGMRAEESVNRANGWGLVSAHHKTGDKIVCPVYGWASDELWAFIRGREIPYCSLYDQGFSRLGCIGCPHSRTVGRLRAFAAWPRFEKKWKRGFQRIWDRRSGKLDRQGRVWFGDRYFKDWREMWNWWLYDLPLPDPRQLKLFEDEKQL